MPVDRTEQAVEKAPRRDRGGGFLCLLRRADVAPVAIVEGIGMGGEQQPQRPAFAPVERRHAVGRDMGGGPVDAFAQPVGQGGAIGLRRSEEHTSELQSLMRTSYAVICLKKKKNTKETTTQSEN